MGTGPLASVKEHGSMRECNSTGHKAPERRPTHRSICDSDYQYGNPEGRGLKLRQSRIDERTDQRTPATRARGVQTPARAASPWSQSETMTLSEPKRGKRTARCTEIEPYCDGCGRTLGRIRLVDVEEPDGQIRVCDDCEGRLNSTILQEVAVYV